MDYLKTLLNIWLKVVIEYIIYIIILFFSYKYYGPGITTITFLVMAFFHIKWWIDLKSKLLAGLLDEFRYQPTNVEEFDFMGLDTESLEQFSKSLHNLGFVQLMEYKPDRQQAEKSLYLARIFAHAQHYCFAEVGQAFPLDKKPLPILFSIYSSWQNEWTFSSTIVKPNGLSYMWRSPKALWSYHPNASATELFQSHLEQRQQIENNLGLIPIKDVSWDFYLMNSQKSTIKRKQNLKRKNIFIGLIEATMFEIKSPSKYMGS